MNRFKIAALALTLGAGFAGCDDDDDSATGGTTGGTGGTGGVVDETFECTVERDGWEQCLDNKVEYCHIVSGMDAHFHWGADCEALGYACTELSDTQAACLDESSTCTAGEFKCLENSAYTCVEGGHWAITPCGTTKHCHEEADEAHCEAVETTGECGGHGHLDESECHCNAGYAHDGEDLTTCVLSPTYMCAAFAETAHQHTVVAAFADYEEAHADLYEPVEVELPVGASFIHFEVTHSDEFVIFADTVGAVDAVLHRTEAEIAGFHEAGANEVCAASIPTQYHVELEMDGEEAPVPYVIRFNNPEAAPTTVRFMVVDE